MSYIKILFQVCLLAFLYLMEGRWPFSKNRYSRMRHAGENVAMAALNEIAIALVLSAITLFVCLWSLESGFGLMHWTDWNPWLEGCVLFVLFDLWMYLWHRANHKFEFFWRFHQVHHSDAHVDASTAFRFHIGEVVLATVIRLPVIVLLGMDIIHLLIYEIVLQPILLFHHSNVALPQRIDSLLRYFIVTPAMHRVHHSDIQEERDSNYGSVLSWWDHALDTYREKQGDKIHFGIPTLKGNEWLSVWGMLKTPFAETKS